MKTILVARKAPDMTKYDSEYTSGSMNKLTVARKCFKNTGSEQTYGSENTSAIMNKFPVARKVPTVEKTCVCENTSGIIARLPVARKVPAVKNSRVVKTILVARKAPDMKTYEVNTLPVA
jgi:hypothetical protein